MLSEILNNASKSPDRYTIEYKCGSCHKGRIRVIQDNYYVYFNSRSLVGTKLLLDRVYRIRYANSRVTVWQALGNRESSFREGITN